MVTLLFAAGVLGGGRGGVAGHGGWCGKLGIFAEADGEGAVEGAPWGVGAVVEVVVGGFVVVEYVVNA